MRTSNPMEVKLSLCLIKHCTVKICIKLHAFLKYFCKGNVGPHWRGGWVGPRAILDSGEEKK
jgi:hypothetical protein